MAFEQQPKNLRQHIQKLAQEYGEKNDPSGWFDILYKEAQGDYHLIPWGKMTVNPILADWFEKNKPNCEGKNALVIGCGLGDDAEYLGKHGYKVTAFDIAPTAINWCKTRFPNSNVHYLIGDLLAKNEQWENKFDLVFECRNIQALPLEYRQKVITNIAKFVKNEGTLLVIDRLRDDESAPDGPPWPLSENELGMLKKLGFQEINRAIFDEDSIINARIEYILVQ